MTNEGDNIQLISNIYKKVFSYIGLAAKSRNLVSGELATEKAIKTKKVILVLIAEDASKNTKKKFIKSVLLPVPLYFFGKKKELGKTIGKDIRTSIGLLDQGLADGIRKQLDNICNGDMPSNTIEPKSGGSKYGKNESI